MRRASTDAVFLAKASTVIEEADESGFWLEFLVEIELVSRGNARPFLREANELVAIFTASRKTVELRLAREAEKKFRDRSRLQRDTYAESATIRR